MGRWEFHSNLKIDCGFTGRGQHLFTADRPSLANHGCGQWGKTSKIDFGATGRDQRLLTADRYFPCFQGTFRAYGKEHIPFVVSQRSIKQTGDTHQPKNRLRYYPFVQLTGQCPVSEKGNPLTKHGCSYQGKTPKIDCGVTGRDQRLLTADRYFPCFQETFRAYGKELIPFVVSQRSIKQTGDTHQLKN